MRILAKSGYRNHSQEPIACESDWHDNHTPGSRCQQCGERFLDQSHAVRIKFAAFQGVKGRHLVVESSLAISLPWTVMNEFIYSVCREFKLSQGNEEIMQKTGLTLSIVLVCMVLASLAAGAEDKNSSGHWVTAWSTAVHAPIPFPGLPPPPVFENQTLRMVVRPAIGGSRIRVRLSNAYGASALEIGAAHIALVDHGSSIAPASDHVLKFGGQAAVEIPTGAPMLTDAVDLSCSPFAELAISLFLPRKTASSSAHLWGQHDTYVSGPGDFTAKVDIPNPKVETSWYYLADVEEWATDQAAAIVTLGDSITDGVGAKQGEYGDWPDLLAKRFADGHGAPFAVANEGIGGNRILHDGAGVSALTRFDRDVLSQPGVTALIVLEGINDIGLPHLKLPQPKDAPPPKENPFAGQDVTADNLILGLKQIIERAHQHGIRVFGATLTPFDGAEYFTPDGEAIRQAVNRWVRTGGAFDGIIDFDAAVCDPQHPSQFREGLHAGDHLHPSTAGYKAMADAIDLASLR
jgi:lysophospholipase L1-like esterase